MFALRVARDKKAHTIAENSIISAAIEICEIALDGECAAKLKN